MSDILIRGMEMPTGCASCHFANFRIDSPVHYCKWLMRPFVRMTERLKDCPLVELPEHGDLIDKEKLYDLVKQRGRNWAGEWCDSECHITGNDIKNSPVIIPSNKEETD